MSLANTPSISLISLPNRRALHWCTLRCLVKLYHCVIESPSAFWRPRFGLSWHMLARPAHVVRTLRYTGSPLLRHKANADCNGAT